MKTLIFLTIILWASSLYAQPFLISDPQTSAEEYVVTIDGVESISSAQDLGDGTVRLYHDLAGVSDGLHNVEVKARNVWGSSTPVPFSFEKILPGVPVNIGLER
ncbi:hypothetical protein LCGC14_2579280 [marine sediment metagenome]|uniref:Bacterial Ig-like domain-containing protein n=1 Tax=marine sediment metagenome TaxID=412755 RepID=A0A0F9D7M0_9ZZZZ